MTIFKKINNKILVDRFLKLNKKIESLEKDGCLKKNCTHCKSIIVFNEANIICDRIIIIEEMEKLYCKIFDNESYRDYTWSEKVNKVKQRRAKDEYK